MDTTQRQLAHCAASDIETVLRALVYHDKDGKRPTLKQVKAMIDSLANAKSFMKAALHQEPSK